MAISFIGENILVKVNDDDDIQRRRQRTMTDDGRYMMRKLKLTWHSIPGEIKGRDKPSYTSMSKLIKTLLLTLY